MTYPIDGFTVPVRKNMPVEYIQKNGNDLQKAVIHMFDYDGDGVLNRKEAKEYNKYELTKFQPGSNVTLMGKNKKEAYTFVYNDISDLKDLTIWNNGIYRRNDGKHITGDAITYNTVKGEYTVSNTNENSQSFNIKS